MPEYEALRGEMASGFAALQKSLDEVKEKQDYTNGDVLTLKLWQAEVKGSLRMLLWLCSLPSMAAAVAAVVMFMR